MSDTKVSYAEKFRIDNVAANFTLKLDHNLVNVSET
jgi:hypothetical protein